MTPEQLIRLGAGLQRLDRRKEWRPVGFVDKDGVRWTQTKNGWEKVS